jgi:hypothetical protein
MVVAYLLSNLQERLELTDEAYARLLPLVNARQRHRREMHERRGAAMRELHELVRRDADEAAIAAAVAKVDRVEVEEAKRLADDLAAIDAELSTIQRAKYRLMEAEVERRVRELVRRITRTRGRGDRDEPRPPTRPE